MINPKHRFRSSLSAMQIQSAMLTLHSRNTYVYISDFKVNSVGSGSGSRGLLDEDRGRDEQQGGWAFPEMI